MIANNVNKEIDYRNLTPKKKDYKKMSCPFSMIKVIEKETL